VSVTDKIIEYAKSIDVEPKVLDVLATELAKVESHNSGELNNNSKYRSTSDLGNEVVSYLSTHDYIKNSQAQKLLGKSATTVRRVMKHLINHNLVIPEGDNKNRIYRLK
jgi:predicted HTH transcriptional regulator